MQALQFVSEEYLLSDSQLHPVQVMGIEGALSAGFSCIALVAASLLPGPDSGVAESWPDTVAQLQNSTTLVVMCLVTFLGVAGGNYFGLRVSGAPLLYPPVMFEIGAWLGETRVQICPAMPQGCH